MTEFVASVDVQPYEKNIYMQKFNIVYSFSFSIFGINFGIGRCGLPQTYKCTESKRRIYGCLTTYKTNFIPQFSDQIM